MRYPLRMVLIDEAEPDQPRFLRAKAANPKGDTGLLETEIDRQEYAF